MFMDLNRYFEKKHVGSLICFTLVFFAKLYQRKNVVSLVVLLFTTYHNFFIKSNAEISWV